MRKGEHLPPSSVIAEVAKDAPAAQKHRPTHVRRQIRVDLTVQEKANLSDQLAQSVGRLNETEMDKAEEISQYNADIKAHRASIDKLAQQVNLGYEMREVACPIKYNEPKVGQKTVMHPETSQPLSVEAMTEPERQENLFDDEDPKARGKHAKENLTVFKKNGSETADAEKKDKGIEFDPAAEKGAPN
jgi:hypothetical protein